AFPLPFETLGMLTNQGLLGSNGKSNPPAAASSHGPAASKPPVGFHGAVGEFKRRLIEATLAQAGGNRTRRAKAPRLARSHLLRLMREFQIRFPASAVPPRRVASDTRPLPRETP